MITSTTIRIWRIGKRVARSEEKCVVPDGDYLSRTETSYSTTRELVENREPMVLHCIVLLCVYVH